MSELNKFEIDALRILNGETAQVMGAWFNACCDVLKARGYATSIPYTITEKGKKYLADIDGSVPDVPELVRYRLHWSDFDTADMEIDNMEGEYVRYNQAAKVIAAKDKEIERLREVLRKAHASLEIDRTGRFEEFKNIINLALDGDANA